MESQTEFDLYICDLDLVDMSGWDIFNQLRDQGNETPFILMSGWKIGWDQEALNARGVAGFLKSRFNQNVASFGEDPPAQLLPRAQFSTP